MRKQSTGTTGETAAGYWFNRHRWKMVRTQPPTRVVYVKGRPTVIHERSDGVPDYTGYEMIAGSVPIYRACEVKEASGLSMPCSRLRKDQRDWMQRLPDGCSYVGILWADGQFEVFGFKLRGAYRKGTGRI